MPRPCRHTTLVPECRACHLATTRADYAQLWDEPEPAQGAIPLPARRWQQRLNGPCRHLGQPTGQRVRCLTCRGNVELKLFGCALHGTCTQDRSVPGTPSCASCPDRAPVSEPLGEAWHWLSAADLARDSVILAGLLPPDTSAVAGIPRSGMVVAAVIAVQRHLPLYELTGGGRLNLLGHGSRGYHLPFRVPAGGPIAVVDDTVWAGSAMRRARDSMARLGKQAVFGCVYHRPEAGPVVDLFARTLPGPHVLSWNVFNCGVMRGHAEHPAFGRGVATDLDGVLAHDEASGGKPGTPYMLPRTLAIPLICTGRHERDRAVTEGWLQRWGARYDRLAMLPDHLSSDVYTIARHKSIHYARSGCGFFVESCPQQAELIHQLTGLPVVCPAEGRIRR